MSHADTPMPEHSQLPDEETSDAAPPRSASHRATAHHGAPQRNAIQAQDTGFDPVLNLIERAARDSAVDIAKMQALFELRERLEDRAAKRSFDAAMAQAKGEIGPIVKTREVDFTTGKGRTRYKYEEFADIAKVIDPVFQIHGLSYRFSIAQEGPKVRVTCIVSHAEGFSETTSLEAAVDVGGSSMNPLQALGSALTYLQRYSLRAALGLAAARDDDGRLGKDDAAKIDVDQLAYVETMLRDTASDVAKFLQTIGCADISNMSIDQFKRGVALLEEKRRRLSKAAAQ